MTQSTEEQACFPKKVAEAYFNPQCQLPYGLKMEEIRNAMNDFVEFLGLSINNFKRSQFLAWRAS